MAKKVTGQVKLVVAAGQANPSPPVGPALGQRGVNIMEFCKAFNAKTQSEGLKPGTPIPVVITVYADRSFTFITKTPPASHYIKEALSLKKGSGTPNSVKVGTIRKSQLEEIARMKVADMTAASIEAAIRSIAGSARSMGVQVED